MMNFGQSRMFSPMMGLNGPVRDPHWQRLNSEWNAREDYAGRHDDELMDIWGGMLPGYFKRMFPRATADVMLNFIKLAWTDISGTLSDTPILEAQSAGDSQRHKASATKREQIGYGYIEGGIPAGERLLFGLAHQLVGLGRQALIVRPNMETGRPQILAVDVRAVRPHFRQTGLGVPSIVESLLIRHEMTIPEAGYHGVLDVRRYSSAPNMPYAGRRVVAYEFVDDTWWGIAGEGGVVYARHGAGECAGWYGMTQPGNDKIPTPMFRDQIGLQAAISQMVHGKVMNIQQNINPMLWTDSDVDELVLGAGVVSKVDKGSQIGRLDPPQTVQVDRDIAYMGEQLGILNRMPEGHQGQPDGKGAYVSGKTLDTVSAAVRQTLKELFLVQSETLSNAIRIAAKMDVANWPHLTKPISPTADGNYRKATYMPARDIGDYPHIGVRLDGMRGYQPFLESMQGVAAGVETKRDAIGKRPGITDPDRVIREVAMEQLEGAGIGTFLAQAQAGTVDLAMLHAVYQRMAKGLSFFKAVEETKGEMERQANAASAEQAQVGALTAPQAPTPNLPGIPAGIFS